MGGKSDKSLKFVYLTKLESDDAYHKSVIDEIQQQMAEERKAFVYNKGYILSYKKPSMIRRIRWFIGKLLTKLKLK